MNPTLTRSHLLLSARMARRACILIAAAGLAVGTGSLALAQEKGDPEKEKAQYEEQKAKILKQMEEARSKLPADQPKPAARPPAPTPPQAPKAETKQQPAKPGTTPGTLKPNTPQHSMPNPVVPVTPASNINNPMAPAGDQAPGVPAEPIDTTGAFSDDGNFHFNFTDAVDLTFIVQYIQQAMNLQIIATDSGLVGQKVTLMTPVTIPREQVLNFLNMLLEQKDYTIYRDTTGVYMITPRNALHSVLGADPSATTRVIPTPGINPQSLQPHIQTLLSAGRAGGAVAPIFVSELGIIIMTDTPGNIALVEEYVKVLLAEQKKINIIRVPVVNIAAASARDRVLELIGSSAAAPGGIARPAGVPVQQIGGIGGSLSNLHERLTLDPNTNAMFFRGRPDEVQFLQSLVQIVDVPNALESRWYPIGTRAAELVSDAAQRQQLGAVTTFESASDSGSGGVGVPVARRVNQPNVGQPNTGFGQQTETTGAGFVIYPEAGGFIYRGTTQQHARVQKLIDDLGNLADLNDTIVFEFIKLKHSKAEDLARTIQDLLNNQISAGNNGGLLGGDLGNRGRNRTGNNTNDRDRRTASERLRDADRRNRGETTPNQPAGTQAAAAGAIGDLSGEDVNVLPDIENNQIIVRAPQRLQAQILHLIERLDIRRPQVYIEAQIVSVTTGDNFSFAAEVQQIIGQYALSTSFGLGGFGTNGQITDPKTVPSGTGLTTALIRSKDVPFIIRTLQTDTNARIVATPQLLVDDNSEASVESKDEQPTSTFLVSGNSTDTNNTQRSFGGYEEAGPKLTVTPQISEGGYLRLDYEIELSAFTGAADAASGAPAARQTNNLKSESVTVPSDTTIVIGGLNQETVTSTVNGIPLLKDIPIVGELFKSTSNNKRNVTLYVFITPKILRDPTFSDARLLTRGPMARVKLDNEIPAPEHERIDIIDSARTDTRIEDEEEIKRQMERELPGSSKPKPPKERRQSGPSND